jgi:hypothetical protein
MDNLKYTGQFSCHNGLPIHAACFDSACNGIMCCIDCLITDHADHIKSTLSIPTLAKKADNHYTMIQNIRSTEEPATEQKELISKQGEILTILTQHIIKEKESVEKIVEESQELFILTTTRI